MDEKTFGELRSACQARNIDKAYSILKSQKNLENHYVEYAVGVLGFAPFKIEHITDADLIYSAYEKETTLHISSSFNGEAYFAKLTLNQEAIDRFRPVIQKRIYDIYFSIDPDRDRGEMEHAMSIDAQPGAIQEFDELVGSMTHRNSIVEHVDYVYKMSVLAVMCHTIYAMKCLEVICRVGRRYVGAHFVNEKKIKHELTLELIKREALRQLDPRMKK